MYLYLAIVIHSCNGIGVPRISAQNPFASKPADGFCRKVSFTVTKPTFLFRLGCPARGHRSNPHDPKETNSDKPQISVQTICEFGGLNMVNTARFTLKKTLRQNP